MPKKPTKKEEAIYIGETPTDKEMHAYFELVEDQKNYSLERWNYLIEEWMLHGIRIEEEKGWLDDGSVYYENLISILKQCYESPIIDFITHWQSECEGNMIDEMKTWERMTKDNYTEVFNPADQQVSEKKYAESVFIDIEHPDNWKNLEINFMKSDMTKMRYKYDGKKSEWMDISHDIKNRAKSKEPVYKFWVKVFMALCEKDEYRLEVANKETHDVIYRPNKMLKKWFLPNTKGGKEINPIYSLGYNREKMITFTKYKSHIQFSYQF